MKDEIEQIVYDYYIFNSLKYKSNDKYNTYNQSDTIASKIFGSSMIAIGLCSEIYKKSDFGIVSKNIILSEIDKNLGIKLDEYDKLGKITLQAIKAEENFQNYINSETDHNLKSFINDFYQNTNILKTTVRTGWIYWGVLTKNLEKISEHVYGVCVLALLLGRLYPNIDINKVIKMLIIHETEEIKIGDITVFDKEIEKKEEKGHSAIEEVFKNFQNHDELIKLILEFDERKTPEAKFAYMCDKLEADLQAIAYEQMGYNHMDNQEKNPAYNSKKVQEIIRNGAQTVAEIWCEYDLDKFTEDNNFTKVLKYAIKKEVYQK